MLEALTALLQDHGRIGLFEEEEPGRRVQEADDGEDPEDPSPVETLDDYAAEQWSL